MRHVGLSEVTVDQIEEARSYVDVVSVQNLYNLDNRKHEDVVDYCERENIAFIPWLPVAGGRSAARPELQKVAVELDATPTQVALAWLLHRSPAMLPIPGTSSQRHLEENAAARSIALSPEQYDRLADAGR